MDSNITVCRLHVLGKMSVYWLLYSLNTHIIKIIGLLSTVNHILFIITKNILQLVQQLGCGLDDQRSMV